LVYRFKLVPDLPVKICEFQATLSARNNRLAVTLIRLDANVRSLTGLTGVVAVMADIVTPQKRFQSESLEAKIRKNV